MIGRPRVQLIPVALLAGGLAVLTILGDIRPTTAEPKPPPNPVTAIERALKVTVLIEGDGIYGSGILIDPTRGYVVTSHHVVKEMRAPRITVRDGRRGTARLVHFDKKLDIALLSVPELAGGGVGVLPLTIGDVQRLRPG